LLRRRERRRILDAFERIAQAATLTLILSHS